MRFDRRALAVSVVTLVSTLGLLPAADAAATTDDPGTAGNDATSFVVAGSAIGTHTKTVTGSFHEGGTVTYTVTIFNPSGVPQLDNPGDEFTDVLPASLTLVSAVATSGTAVADVPTRTVHWNGTIAAAGSVTITITATINAGTATSTISNQGTVFFDADGNGTNESRVVTDDPGTAAADDPTSFVVAPNPVVPTADGPALLLLGLALAGLGLLALRPRTLVHLP